MKLEGRIVGFGIIILLVLGNPLRSFGQILDVSLEDRIAMSPVVIEGKVLSSQSYWDKGHHLIYTAHRLEVTQRLKGSLSSGEIELITLGGTVYPEKLVVHPSMEVETGDVGMYFLKPKKVQLDNASPSNLKQFSGLFSSLSVVKYNLEDKTATDAFHSYGDITTRFYSRLNAVEIFPSNEWLLHQRKTKSIENREILAITISSFSPTTSTAGTFSVLTINGTGFGSSRGAGKVEFSNADNGGGSIDVLPLSTGYVSWSDTKIEVEIPKGAGTGNFRVTNNAGDTKESSSSLTVRYNISNVNYNNRHRRTNLVDADNSGGILFTFATTFNNNVDAKNAFIRALDTWRCSGGTEVYFDDGGSTANNTTQRDGENVIRWDNLGGNPLGVSHSYYTGCNGGTAWFLTETDIRFDDGTNWNYDAAPGSTGATQIDFESVALHETGHSHQLGHVINSNDVMHYSTSAGTEKRSLSMDDLDGGNDVLNWSSGVCGKPAMAIYNCQAMALEEISLLVEKRNDKAKLYWSTVLSGSVRSFTVERRLMGNDSYEEMGDVVPNDALSDLDFSFEDAHPVRGCWYRIRANLEDQQPVYSNRVRFEGAVPTGWSIYPNPFENRIILRGEVNRLRSITVYNTMGAVVQAQSFLPSEAIRSSVLVSIEQLPSGVYFLVLKDEFGSILFEKRLIKK